MLNWIETVKELPEVEEVNDYLSSGIVLGYYDEDCGTPYIVCMFEKGDKMDAKGKISEWQHWISPYGDGWAEMPCPPDFWAELNPPE